MSSPHRFADPEHATDGERRRFLADGFAVVDRLVDDETVDELRRAYDDVIERRVHARGDRLLGEVIRQVKHPSKDHPTFAENAAIVAGLRLGRCVFPGDALAKVYEMLIDKPPGTAHETPWHQDVGYFGRPVAPVGMRSDLPDIQLWVALDPVDEENACMQFVPRPYGTPALGHAVVSGDPDDESRLIAIEEPFDASGAVACPLRPGGCTLHLLGTPHRTGVNLSERPRRAYIFNVGPQSFASVAEDALEQTWGPSARLR